MQTYRHTAAGLLFFATLLAPGAASADRVGVASAVVNQVEGVSGGNRQSLAVGSAIFENEHIRTGDASTAQLLFLDKTSLSLGPHAEVVLDRFLYDPKRRGHVVINATQGALRFITGSMNPTSYTIKTPVATLGIRGTILDLLMSGDPINGYTMTVILVEGSAIITLPNGQVLNLTQPGTAFVIGSNGQVQGPVQWDGTIVSVGGNVSFPLYGWYFQGEPPPNGLPPTQIGSIDQLNAIIAEQLKIITHAPPTDNGRRGR